MIVARALISVSDKTGIVEFARGLQGCGIELVSTGGTARVLKKGGVKVREVSDFTGFPEVMSGRVKTLHPKVHGGILSLRDSSKHLLEAKENGIEFIDMVVVNLYPFEKTVEKNADLEEVIENIDIGGPAMLRSAAKNYKSVAVVCNPDSYNEVLEELKKHKNALSSKTLELLSLEAFSRTARYDAVISKYLAQKFSSQKFPKVLTASFEKQLDLRYGENPHQKAAFYAEGLVKEPCVANAEKLQGKQLSYNNFLDADAAIEQVKEFCEPCCVIVKHGNPTGVGIGKTALDAYEKALATDTVSSFGGIVCFNVEVSASLSERMSKRFWEIIIAPRFSKKALEVFSSKKSLRVLLLDGLSECSRFSGLQLRSLVGGLLVQDRNVGVMSETGLKTVSKKRPTAKQLDACLFAWKVAKHVKSNAIVYALEDRTIGIGAGQMSRVDSARLAVLKAKNAGLSVKGAVMASDAFFPFRDAVDAASKEGISVIIQPGGSLRDKEVITAADEHGIAMVLTGMRHFRH
ncbi:MAG: bifunctional phosphoribosylaminoimidazolecarboxamide formyltransferase/IMP cyclohydrolase [Candidatus Micrarchaeia archaeon]